MNVGRPATSSGAKLSGGGAPSGPSGAGGGIALTSAAVALADAFGGSPPIVSEFISAGSIFFPPGPSIAIF